MDLRTVALWGLVAMLALGGPAAAQEARPEPSPATLTLIRITTDSASGNARWEGTLERLTRDSLALRIRGTGSLATFARSAVLLVERERATNVGQWALVGCLTVGGASGFLGYAGTHDPDSPGLQRRVGTFGLITGCILGAFGGAVAAGAHGHDWEVWTLPEDG